MNCLTHTWKCTKVCHVLMMHNLMCSNKWTGDFQMDKNELFSSGNLVNFDYGRNKNV